MKRLSAASGLPMRDISDEAMAVLQAYNWPGNVRQLRNIVERLSDPRHRRCRPRRFPPICCRRISTAPARRGRKGAKTDLIISLPLREAREIFEREYLLAQINRFGGNISRTASFIGMERSALHRKLKSLGVSSAPPRPAVQRMSGSQHAHRALRPGASPMSSGRYVRARRSRSVHIEDRGLQFADCVYEVFAVMDGRLFDATAISTGWNAVLRELKMPMPLERSALAVVLKETVRRNRVHDGFLYLQVTRGAMQRDHPIPANVATRR